MVSNNPAAVLDRARASDIFLHPVAHPHGSLSQLSALRLWLVPTTSSEHDVERATWTPLQGSPNGREQEPEEITNPSLPVHGEGTTGSLADEEPTATTTLPWHGRTLSSFTLYGEFSIACTPEQFASVRARLQQEWSFDGGFLVGIAAVNAAILAITTDSIFKIDSYAHSAVASSSAACGLGIACDVWFLVRYNWVDLETFIYRSRDVYGSFVSFSLSSRMPTFCMLVSSISLMCFLGLTAFDASPAGVLVIVVLVVLVMTIQFIVYGTHQFAISALQIWKAGVVNIVKRLRGFVRRGG